MAEVEQLKKGDVVMLRSGGPKMTITEGPVNGVSGYYCEWFDRTGILSRARFPAESLKKVRPSGVELI
jgi:uncharacterized protein YodC (DUF2158 family)